MAGEKNFKVRLSVEGAEQMMAAFRSAAGQSEEMRKAFDALVQSSPTLASSLDRAGAAAADTARKMRGEGVAGANELSQALKRTTEAGREMATGATTLGAILQGAAFGGAAGAAAAAMAALADAVSRASKAIPEAGDAYKLIGARLEAATGSAASASAVMGRLKEISAQTGSSLNDSAQAFGRFSVAARDLGASNGQVLNLVSGLQKFAVISGVEAQQAAAATMQLSQALASGRFQGDELRSVMENMPQLAEALAKQLGVSTGQLRQMGADGKLTSDVVFPALLRAVEGIDEKFQRMPGNMGRSMNAAKVAFDDILAAFDKAYEWSDKIARKWDAIADALKSFRTSAFPTVGERLTAGRDAASADLARLEAEAGKDRANGLTPGVNGFMLGGVTDEQLNRARAAVRAWETELANFRRENRELSRAELDDNRSNGASGTLSGAKAEADEWLKAHDKIAKAKAEDNAALASIDKHEGVGSISSEEATRRRAVALDEYNEALKKTAGTTKQTADSTDILAEAMDKLRAKDDARFASIETSLDPYAAALKRQADALETLAAAETAYATSGGERGLSPARAAELRTNATERYTKEIEGINKKADDTGRAFDQFFSRATSGFEDAIVKGKSFGDVLKGLEGDILRLILRITVLDPLSKSLSGAFSGAAGGGLFSGVGGAISSGFSWLTGLFGFADGGVMTSAGPLPLNRYAGGGVANRPQLAMFGEGSTPEAYVPLPDGRSIPVAMQGGGGMSITHAPVFNITSNLGPDQLLAVVNMASNRARSDLVAEINRGGGLAKTVGRRR